MMLFGTVFYDPGRSRLEFTCPKCGKDFGFCTQIRPSKRAVISEDCPRCRHEFRARVEYYVQVDGD